MVKLPLISILVIGSSFLFAQGIGAEDLAHAAGDGLMPLVIEVENNNPVKRARNRDDDETEYGTFPPSTRDPPTRGPPAEPRPIVHMNKKQKDVFVKRMKKAGPGLKRKLLKFLYRQREDDIAELKERLGPDAEWPTRQPK